MTTVENKFQRQQRITRQKNVAEGRRIQDQAGIDGFKFDVVRWTHSRRGRHLCGLRAYARACWSCASDVEFIEAE